MKFAVKVIDQSVNNLKRDAMKNSELNPTLKGASLKLRLIKKLSAEYANVKLRLVRQAVNEADALASLTTVPFLVLPTLAEEKVQKAAEWTAHQYAVLHGEPACLAA
jgi:hypothetical protein